MQIVDIVTHTHALVHFDADDIYSVVPVKKVAAEGELCAGSNCTVVWGKGQIYSGTIVDPGKTTSSMNVIM